MVLKRTKSPQYGTNGSFGETINKFLDCNIKKHKESWKKKEKKSKTTRIRFYLIKTVYMKRCCLNTPFSYVYIYIYIRKPWKWNWFQFDAATQSRVKGSFVVSQIGKMFTYQRPSLVQNWTFHLPDFSRCTCKFQHQLLEHHSKPDCRSTIPLLWDWFPVWSNGHL